MFRILHVFMWTRHHVLGKCKAKFAHQGQSGPKNDPRPLLTFQLNDVIELLDQSHDVWWEVSESDAWRHTHVTWFCSKGMCIVFQGRLQGREGIFPATFVQVLPQRGPSVCRTFSHIDLSSPSSTFSIFEVFPAFVLAVRFKINYSGYMTACTRNINSKKDGDLKVKYNWGIQDWNSITTFKTALLLAASIS